jgi:glucose-1-phosphate cytidylyltransferase
MKVVILAGGLGTRISEYTKTVPKPMIRINGKPLIYYIMKHYSKFGFKEFYVALGYKGEIIKKYFNKNYFGWKVNLINTGLKTMTGGRLKRLKNFLQDETFMLTYGDGVSNVDLNKLIKFHKKNKKLVSMTAVRPQARFGAIKFKGNKVSYFKEKSKLDEGWVNGGFFVIEPDFLKLIKSDKTQLEVDPLEKISKNGQLVAYKHYDFWQCMDTSRDKIVLEKIIKNKKIKF